MYCFCLFSFWVFLQTCAVSLKEKNLPHPLNSRVEVMEVFISDSEDATQLADHVNLHKRKLLITAVT